MRLCKRMVGSMPSNYLNYINGTPVYIATKCIQRRKHKKWRTNEKWANRYGYIELNYMPVGHIMNVDDVIWMTKRDFERLGLNK